MGRNKKCRLSGGRSTKQIGPTTPETSSPASIYHPSLQLPVRALNPAKPERASCYAHAVSLARTTSGKPCGQTRYTPNSSTLPAGHFGSETTNATYPPSPHRILHYYFPVDYCTRGKDERNKKTHILMSIVRGGGGTQAWLFCFE